MYEDETVRNSRHDSRVIERILTIGDMGKLIRLLIKAVITAACIAALAYGSLLLINLKDAEPSELTKKMRLAYDSHPIPEDSENAFLIVLAFSALPESDPHDLGIARRDWIQSSAPEFDGADDPLLIDYEPRSDRPGEIVALAEVCKDPDLACVAALDGKGVVVEEWLESENWLLQRYLRLTSMSKFLERGTLDIAAPLPSYHVVLEGQKLLFVEALIAGRSGDTEKVNALLSQDLKFWRLVLSQSDLLITKMISTVAISKNFKFGNLILRELHPELVGAAVPDSWFDPMTAEELSMERCFVGEWMFSGGIAREYENSQISPLSGSYYAEDQTVWDRILWAFAKPLWQPQDIGNRYAALLIDMATEIDGTLDDMPLSLANAEATADAAFKPMSSAYNITGDILFEGTATTLPGYAARVADLEGLRRAAVLLTRIRSGRVLLEDLRDSLASGDLKNPYTGEPFGFDEEERAVVFQGLEKHGRGNHHLPL